MSCFCRYHTELNSVFVWLISWRFWCVLLPLDRLYLTFYISPLVISLMYDEFDFEKMTHFTLLILSLTREIGFCCSLNILSGTYSLGFFHVWYATPWEKRVLFWFLYLVLVSLFKGISTFVSYLILKSSLQKNSCDTI